MNKDSLGDRMKIYEEQVRTRLLRRTPTIIRLDGKAFHTFTRGLDRPFDTRLHAAMVAAAKALCEEVQGCRLAYTQSDEISLLLTDWENFNTQAWFDAEVQKQVSVAASICTAAFMNEFALRMGDGKWKPKCTPAFDARCFNLPPHEVCNYFIWRQQDAGRNSISMLAQAHFSHKRLQGVSSKSMMDMLMLETEPPVNWNDCPTSQKRGTCVVKETYEVQVNGAPFTRTRWAADHDIPIFTQDRNYIERRVPGPL